MISVIIPVYNGERYIEDCLQSVLTQENAEFEVIIVNDGSTDRTAELCKTCLRNYKNIQYIEQENQGQGSARNYGIRQASGEWLVFLDADDELVPGALHKLQEVPVEGADIICYEFFLKRRFGRDEHVRLFDGVCRSNSDLIRVSSSYLWDKMFRMDFWRKEEIVLEDVYGEDLEAVYLLEALCTRFVFLKEPLVCHYERESNLSANSEKVMEITRAVEGMLNEFIRRGLFERYKASLFYIVRRQCKIYQLSNFSALEIKQQKIICEGVENILNTYFIAYCDWLKILQKTELVLIGYQCRFWYEDELLFKQITFFPELERFVMEDWKSTKEFVLYMIDLSQEGRCQRFGTRTNKWQKHRWKDLIKKFTHALHQSGKLLKLFVFEGEVSDNRELFELMIRQENCCMIQKDGPVLEMLVSKEILSKSRQEEKLFEFEEVKTVEDFWNKGEQYRLQFNENILNAWLIAKNQNKNFEDFFVKRGYRNIAVYGMGYLGDRLLEELEDSKVKVKYGIDRDMIEKGELSVYTIEDEFPKADVIIVTVVHLFFDIRYELRKRTDIPVVSLEEILESLLSVKEKSRI